MRDKESKAGEREYSPPLRLHSGEKKDLSFHLEPQKVWVLEPDAIKIE